MAAKDLTDHRDRGRGLPARAAWPRTSRCRSPSAVNPARAGAVAALRERRGDAAARARAELTEADWARARREARARYEAWAARKAGARGREARRRARARDPRLGAGAHGLAALIAKDKALEAEATASTQVEKLVRYHRDLYQLCNNFVSFKDFYDARRRRPSSRWARCTSTSAAATSACAVEDAGQARRDGGAGGRLPRLLRLRAQGDGREDDRSSPAFTAGDCDNLMVGRNGIFYDRKGATGTPPSPRSSTTRSASARRSGRPTRSWCA